MNGTKFKVLMHMDMIYVDTYLLGKGIYGCVKPNIYSYDDDTESNLVINAERLCNEYIALPKGFKISLTQ
jgi:hypothetical protein